MKNKILLLLLLANSCNCDGYDQLIVVDGQPCIKDDGQIVILTKADYEFIRYNTGECHTGIYKSSEDGEYCVGYALPSGEICNGLDDDCDGEIDEESWLSIGPGMYGNDCMKTQKGVCKLSEETCINGEYVCVPPSWGYGKERCDNLDNDCDGEVDEDTADEPIFDERYVYTGPQETINIGECRAGYKECVDGHMNVRNMRTPVQEICGNDDDDDCDGLTDEDEDGNSQNDYLFIIDYSGSMANTINSVATAICNWSSQGILNGSRFAVIAIGYCRRTETGYDNCGNEMALLTDFTDAQTACEVIRENNVLTNSGGSEYQINATLQANIPSNPLTVTWGTNNKKIIIFSDEDMQQFDYPDLETAVGVVVDQCYEKDYSLSAFINWDSNPQLLWMDMVQSCNGFLDYLDNNPNGMIQTLNYWIGEEC